jgi:hypothetical protein
MQRTIAAFMFTIGLAGIGLVGGFIWRLIDPVEGIVCLLACALATFVFAPLLWWTGETSDEGERPTKILASLKV